MRKQRSFNLSCKWLLLIGCLLLSGQLLAQTRTVTGKVTDATDNPIANVSVVVKGTAVGTTTAADGTYSIRVPAGGRVLIFSSVGLMPIEHEIGSRTNINASMTAADRSLQDVVVVGYGTQQKNAFTGSAAKVDVTKFSDQISASVDKQLAGRAAGVQVTNAGGLANTPATIRIRGVQSLSLSNDPLIIVDGVPIVTGNLALATNSNALGDINPSDIESFDILKDGSATAIYGSRAANGVILITTKKGKSGRARVTFDGTDGWANALKKFSTLNAKQFEELNNEKLVNDGLPKAAGVNTAVDTANTDWQSKVLIKNALTTSNTLAISGGSDKVQYYTSLNYGYTRGIIISNYNRAYRIRGSVDYEVNKFVKVGNSISISRQEDGDQNNGANALGGAIAAAIQVLPNVSPYSATGYGGYNIGYPANNLMDKGPNSRTVDNNWYNVAWTLRNDKLYSDKYRILDNTYIEISPIKGLKLRTQAGVDDFIDYSLQSLNPFHGDGFGSTGSIFNGTQNILNLVWSSYGTYGLSLGDHNLLFTAGYDVQKTTSKNFTATGSNESDPFYIQQNVISGGSSIQSIGGNFTNSGFLSSFGRFNYDFRNKYFVQASVRRDGQSYIPSTNNKYGTFPGFSVGWRPSQEEFWQHNVFLSKWISEAKLKGSYAKVGNTLGSFSLTNFGNAPYGNVSGLGAVGVGNPQLKWETSIKWDGGVELGIWRNRINLSADYFINNDNNLILQVPTPLSAGIAGSTGTGGGPIAENIGNLNNKGIEITVGGYVVQHKDFSWNLSVNYSHITNHISSLYPVAGVPVKQIADGNYDQVRVGYPIHVLWGYRSAGVNTENGNPMWYKADGTLVQLSLQNGSLGAIYAANGKNDGTLGAKSSLTGTDMTALGNGLPQWFGGVFNTFTYKSFSLDIMFRYSGGNKIMNVTRQDILDNMNFENNGLEMLRRWTAPGQVTDVPKVVYGQGANISQSNIANSRFVESGNFLKLQNVTLSYNLNPKLLTWSNGNIRSVKAFVQGQNLHTWTKYKGIDPENITQQGVDDAVSPQVKIVSVGLSLGF